MKRPLLLFLRGSHVASTQSTHVLRTGSSQAGVEGGPAPRAERPRRQVAATPEDRRQGGEVYHVLDLSRLSECHPTLARRSDAAAERYLSLSDLSARARRRFRSR